MVFNPESSKTAQEVLFSRKMKIQVHPTISLNNVQFEKVSYQKHLSILLDEKQFQTTYRLCYLKSKQRYFGNEKS